MTEKLYRAVGIVGGGGARWGRVPPNNLHKYAVLLITKVCHFKKNYVCPPQSVKKFMCAPQSVIASYGPAVSVKIESGCQHPSPKIAIMQLYFPTSRGWISTCMHLKEGIIPGIVSDSVTPIKVLITKWATVHFDYLSWFSYAFTPSYSIQSSCAIHKAANTTTTILARIAQSVTCLTADPVVGNSIPAWSHTGNHEIHPDMTIAIDWDVKHYIKTRTTTMT